MNEGLVPTSWTVFGFEFHAYGLIVGLALVVSWWLIAKRLTRLGWSDTNRLDLAGLSIVLFGVFGARVWHLATDWSLYQAHPWAAIQIWQGGLSILGAVAGGMVGAWLVTLVWSSGPNWLTWLDSAVFGLPIGQAIGRWANFVNQELYGYPTTLPWGISIDAKHRLPQFANLAVETRFHPLFAYEMIATASAGLVWWWLASPAGERWRPAWWHLGSGAWFASYVWYYALVRFSLDWARPDKTVGWGNLGVNQLVLLGIVIMMTFWLLVIYRRLSLVKSR